MWRSDERCGRRSGGRSRPFAAAATARASAAATTAAAADDDRMEGIRHFDGRTYYHNRRTDQVGVCYLPPNPNLSLGRPA